MIHKHYPHVEVVASNYPPSPTKVAVSKVVGFSSMGTIAVTLFGKSLFTMTGITPPDLYYALESNKMGSCIGAWFVGNIVSANLLNTGAFEVYYDGETIFSKLETGSLPRMDVIMSRLSDSMADAERRGLESKPSSPRASLPHMEVEYGAY